MRVFNLSRLLRFALIIVGLLCHGSNWAVAQDTGAARSREVIVSYADGTGKLQLYRVMEDG